ncbi:RDD family protein [Kitasatospora viridis]|uniref:Putative RDD family membrane protein YckC n=1 Tax=Kitasatospora viridis TaxID=281105 RepID=A0A561UJN3_9ACTN|nr:RDD family protein [Kitasatospora viridis]TWF99567.1 putative RDD family membrane protein YckC [Kitasatospora viridis]
MSYPPDPNNPYGQPQQQAPYGVPPQQSPYAQPPTYGYPQQQAMPPYGGYQAPPAPPQYGYAPVPAPVLASWGSRVGAYFIDGLIMGLPVIIAYVVGGAMLATSIHTTTCPPYDPNDPNTLNCVPQVTSSGGQTGLGLVIILFGIALGIGLLLWQVAREGSTGQTVGKKAVGIRLVRELDGRPLGFGMAFVRKLAHFLDSMLCGLGYLWPLWDDKGQCFADKVTSSLVIRG